MGKKRRGTTKEARRRKARRNPGDMLRRGLELEQAGELDEAEATFRQIISAHPRLADAWHIRASVARRRGDPDAAIRYYRRATTLRDDGRDHNGLGIVLAESGDVAAAIESFERAVAASPHPGEATYNLASALEDAGRLDEAAERYEEAIQHQPMLAAAHYNLGGVELRRRNHDRAIRAYRRALQLDPGFADASYNLGHALRLEAERSEDESQRAEAAACFERVLESQPDHAGAWLSLGLLHKQRGATDAALEAFQRCLEVHPDHPTATHMIAALSGTTRERAPAGYVEQLFDAYAAHFDESLVEGLAYTVPQQLAAMVADEPADGVLDLGCGTGLVGHALGEDAPPLVGVDLSAKMVEAASARGVYREVHRADIIAFLEGDPRRWSAITAADVLVYLGDLEPLFTLVAERLEPGGRFLASAEVHEGEGYTLRASGRFAHAWSYLETCAEGVGLTVDAHVQGPLRREAKQVLEGHVFVLRRPAVAPC